MPHRRYRSVFVLAGMVSALLVGGAARADMTAVQTPAMAVRLLAGGPGSQTDPHISGSLVAYTLRTSSGFEIHYVGAADPSSDAAVPGNARDSRPDVSGNNLVFQRFDPAPATTRSIQWFDTSNPGAGPVVLSPAPGISRGGPAIGADTVAYEQSFGDTLAKDVCVSTLTAASAPTTCLTNVDATHQRINRDPAVSPDGDVVTYSSCAMPTPTDPNPACSVLTARRTAGAWTTPIRVTSSSAHEMLPATDGARVTFGSDVDGDSDVWWANVDGTDLRKLAFSDAPGSEEGNPNISAGVITFERTLVPGSPADLYAYDTTTGTLYRLTNTPDVDETLNGVAVAADGTVRVVWAQTESPQTTENDLYIGEFRLSRSSYELSGFFAPVDNLPKVNLAKAGQTIPLKFSLAESSGQPVTVLASASVKVTDAACDLGSTSDLLEEYASGGSGLQNLGGGSYQFNWATPKSYAQSCKHLVLSLPSQYGGRSVSAEFRFTK